MPSPRRARRSRTAALALLPVAAVGLAAPASARTVGPAVAATTTTTTCPTDGILPFTAALTNGTFQIGKNAKSTGASATACGTITTNAAGELVSVIKRGNLKFKPTSTKLLLLTLPTVIKPTANVTGPTVLGDDGSISTTLRSKVMVTVDVFGAKCSFPLDLTLTTGKSGSLTGSPLKDDGSGKLVGKVVSNDFTVPKFTSSTTCPAIISESSNLLVGTPLAAGASSASFDIALTLPS